MRFVARSTASAPDDLDLIKQTSPSSLTAPAGREIDTVQLKRNEHSSPIHRGTAHSEDNPLDSRFEEERQAKNYIKWLRLGYLYYFHKCMTSAYFILSNELSKCPKRKTGPQQNVE